MKKTIRLMALVAMAAGLAFASCEDDINNPGGGDTPGGGGGTETAEWVDLGLPSGLLWAECNLGATKPEEYGDYYAWGETSTKEVYTGETYKYCTAVDEEGWVKTLSKYNTDSEYGTPDNLTTLQPSDDVATQKLGNGARMPTETEWCELLANTNSEWTSENGVYGRKLTASNGKSLFFPAAGGRYGSELLYAGEHGFYWSSSLLADYPDDAWGFYFNSGNQDVGSGGYRHYGNSVRAVRASQN